MNTKSIIYQDQEAILEGFLAYTSEKKGPLVILSHSWKGRDAFICEKVKLIASWGYHAFAIDMYGQGIIGKTNEENAVLKQPFIEDRLFLKRRLLKGYEEALSIPFIDRSKIVVIGFGFGALCALDLARSGVHLTGAVSVYGHFNPPRHVKVEPIRAKILLLHGYNDPIAPVKELYHFQKELEEQNISWQSHIYGNTLHAFANPQANSPKEGLLYQPASAKHAWESIQLFLKECFLS